MGLNGSEEDPWSAKQKHGGTTGRRCCVASVEDTDTGDKEAGKAGWCCINGLETTTRS